MLDQVSPNGDFDTSALVRRSACRRQPDAACHRRSKHIFDATLPLCHLPRLSLSSLPPVVSTFPPAPQRLYVPPTPCDWMGGYLIPSPPTNPERGDQHLSLLAREINISITRRSLSPSDHHLGRGGFSMKNGGVFYETCILMYPDVSCVYPDVSHGSGRGRPGMVSQGLVSSSLSMAIYIGDGSHL